MLRFAWSWTPVAEPRSLRRPRESRVERLELGVGGGIVEVAQRFDLDRRGILGELAAAGGLVGVALHGLERSRRIATAQRSHRDIEELDLAGKIDA
jgi:hypothetical protein